MQDRPISGRQSGPAYQRARLNMPEHVNDIVLQPGEWYFGDCETRIRTVLGSCVSLTVWHPVRRIGGMCHYMLPSRKRAPMSAFDARFADDAFALLVNQMRAAGTDPDEYELKMFGAGNMFLDWAGVSDGEHVAERNLAAARELAAGHRLRLVVEQLGGAGYREVIFDVWSGDVWVRHHESTPPAIGDHAERGMNET